MALIDNGSEFHPVATAFVSIFLIAFILGYVFGRLRRG